jgi:hypothetical protein
MAELALQITLPEALAMVIEAKRSLDELAALNKVAKAQFEEACAIAEPMIIASGENSHHVPGDGFVTYVARSDSMQPDKGACVARLQELGQDVPCSVVTRRSHFRVKAA